MIGLVIVIGTITIVIADHPTTSAARGSQFVEGDDRDRSIDRTDPFADLGHEVSVLSPAPG